MSRLPRVASLLPLLPLAFLVACSKPSDAPTAASSGNASAGNASAPASSSPAVAPPPSASAALPTHPPSGGITFVEDDYPRALAEARRRGVPIFVDAWAPWCHTCLSLRSFVLHDPELKAKAGDRFVWLAIDTEKESNAAFVKKFPLQFWPTLWVLDAETEKPVMKWPGSLTLPELLTLLDDAALAQKQKSTGGEAGAALLRGDQAVAEGKRDDAIRAYREALAAAPASWPRRGRAVDSLATQLAVSDPAACLALAESEAPRLAPGTNVANVLGTGLSCAALIDKGRDKGKDTTPPKTPAPGAALADAAEKLARDRTVSILADDRSSLFESLNEWLKEQGPSATARRLDDARAWAAFLEGEARRATDKEARVVFDAHRMSAYFALGDPARALPMIKESALDFPQDYNHPARLARVYLETKQLDEADAAVKKALSLAYGPRKLRLYDLQAKILTSKGDAAGAKAALATGVQEGEAMTLTGSYTKVLADMKTKVQAP